MRREGGLSERRILRMSTCWQEQTVMLEALVRLEVDCWSLLGAAADPLASLNLGMVLLPQQSRDQSLGLLKGLWSWSTPVAMEPPLRPRKAYRLSPQTLANQDE